MGDADGPRVPNDWVALVTGGIFSVDSVARGTEGRLEGEFAHPRTRLRKHILHRLRGYALAPERILESRAHNIDRRDLPVICVYTIVDETLPEPYTWEPRILHRRLNVAIHIIMGTALGITDASLDDAVDSITRLVELVLIRDRGVGVLGGLAMDITLGQTEITMGDGGQAQTMQALVPVLVDYQDEFIQPVGDALTLICAQWDFASPDGVIEAVDKIDLSPDPIPVPDLVVLAASSVDGQLSSGNLQVMEATVGLDAEDDEFFF